MPEQEFIKESSVKPHIAFFLTLKQNLKMGESKWHCMTCGKVFYSTYNKQIITIFEGNVIHLESYSGILCWNCKTLYIIE